MKSLPANLYDKKAKNLYEGLWQIFVLILLAASLLFYAIDVGAAELSFNPNSVTVDVEPGQVVAVPVSVSLKDTVLPNYFASFDLAFTGGSLDPRWVAGNNYITLNRWHDHQQVDFIIRPPVNAVGGTYSATFSTVWLRSNESIVAVDYTVYVNIIGQPVCDGVPTFSTIASSPDKIEKQNNKPVSVALSGSVHVREGCEIESMQYVLTDEYGEFDRIEEVVFSSDGQFKVDVPMAASRNGDDKDGRQYMIEFFARNEAGVGQSDMAVFVVEHDSRKK